MHVLDVTRRGSQQESRASGCSVGGAGVHVIGVKLKQCLWLPWKQHLEVV